MKTSKINYICEGQGDPVLLIHGLAASLHQWQWLMPALIAAGYQVYAVDLLGHGESAKPDEPQHYHVEQVYQHLREWIESLRLDKPPIIICHSLGGYLSLTYALESPHKVRGVVLIDPFYSRDQLTFFWRILHRRPGLGSRTLRHIPAQVIHTIFNFVPTARGASKEVNQQSVLDYKRASPHIVFIPRTVKDLTPMLGQVPHRTLVIWGEKDLTLNPASFPTLVAQMPNAIGHPVPGDYHQPHVSQPGTVNKMILEFIREL